MITTGVTGAPWRASVTSAGDVTPWDGGKGVRWYVAAEDRWHTPSAEAAVRQQRLLGTAVTETRVRVPNGDVVQRVYSVADAGGITVIEVENESTRPVAIAFDRSDLLTERPVGRVPIEGIDLPEGSFVLPLGHAATLRVGLAHSARSGPLPSGLPTPRQVANGWLALAERASRLVLPDGEVGSVLAERVVSERCELALGAVPDLADDPSGFTVGLAELVRLGEDPDDWLPDVVVAVERIGPVESWDADRALVAAARVLRAAGEGRARRDLERIVSARRRSAPPPSPPDGVRLIAWVEQMLADGGALLARGLPAAWLGQSLDVYGIPTGDVSSVAYALRWHGARPAVLWEQRGGPVELTAPVLAPAWSTLDASGEALWPQPPDADAATG